MAPLGLVGAGKTRRERPQDRSRPDCSVGLAAELVDVGDGVGIGVDVVAGEILA